MSEMLKKTNSDDLVDIGEEHHRAGRLQEAEAHYRAALEIDAGHPGALYYLANIAYEDGRLSFAAEILDELLRNESNDSEAWHLYGLVALKNDDCSRAIEYLKKSVMIESGFALAHYSLGSALGQQGDVDAALLHFQRVIALDPTFVEAYRAIGNLFHAQKRFDEAIQSYQQAIKLKPDFKLAYEGVGGILLSQEKWNEAIAIYQKAIAENTSSALIYVGLGVAHSSVNNNKEAVNDFEQAISIDPQCFLAHFHLASMFYKQGLFSKAVDFYEQALAINNQDTHLLKKLADTLLYKMRDYDKAADVYKQLLELEPNDAIARHHFLACSGQATPVRADDAYIENTFDVFSETFDDVLVGQTKYCGPQLLIQAIQRELGAGTKQFTVLDAGCGTGLCGLAIAEYASQLTGVDLSAGMLAKAKLRNVYDELIKAELTEYLQSKTAVFDLIVSGDTFNYFGELDNLIAAARGAMHDNGYLFFTVESLEGDTSDFDDRGYQLYPHGRYGHTEAYLRESICNNGFAIVSMETNFLRYENSRAVQAFVVSCRKSSN